MSILLIIILALTVNLLPEKVEEFSIEEFPVEMSPAKPLRFSKRKDGGWEATSLPKGKMIVYIKGFMFATTINGKKVNFNTSRFLGVKTLDQIKDLKRIKNGSQEIKIERKESEIFLQVKQKPIKINGKFIKLDRLVKISWKK